MNVRVAAFWLLAIAVADVRYFRYERPIVGIPSQASQTCVALDGTVYAHSQPLLSDLRLYRDGKETPYAVRIAEPVAAATKNIAPLNLGEQGGHVVFDAAMPERAYNDVELDVAAHDFIATVDVFGSQSQTGGSSTKIGTYTIFDFTREKLGRSTVLHLPESDFRYLHFRVDGPLKPDDVTGLSLTPSAEAKPHYVTVAESTQVIEKNRETLTEFSLPANVPVDRVEFVAQAQPVNFSRDVTVTVTAQKSDQAGESREAEASTSSGSVLRLHGVHNGHQIDEERLSVEPPVSATSYATEWAIKIDNGDDVPLQLQSVRLQMLERTLCFEATPGASYTLYYGDSSLTAPRYDYATLFSPEVNAARAALGPEKNNPDYRPRPDERPFTEKHPGLLWTALVLVVVLLGGIALRSAKQVQKQ
jgi:Protein of unknown function (DUF3999)